MPYKTNSDLPEPVQHKLPEHGQTIYREAFNNAWEYYSETENRESGSREEVAHRVAWAGVKQKYKRNDHGKWIRKE